MFIIKTERNNWKDLKRLKYAKIDFYLRIKQIYILYTLLFLSAFNIFVNKFYRIRDLIIMRHSRIEYNILLHGKIEFP